MQKYRYAGAAGFTLIELLVVLAILAMIAALAVPQVMKHLGGSRSKTAAVQIETLGSAIDLYHLETGNYPAELEALVRPPSGVAKWDGPYLKKTKIPDDPWGAAYVYRFPGEHGEYDLISLGADRAEGGEGENQDVSSWQ